MLEDHRYPFARASNPHVKLGVVCVRPWPWTRSGSEGPEGYSNVWMDLGEDEDIYLARVNWMCDGTLTAQIENRRQTQLDLLSFDLETGKSGILLCESSDVWINLHDLYLSFYWQARGDTERHVYFLWGSERNGFMQLFLYKRTAEGSECVGDALTMEKGVVEGVAGISPARNILYFSAQTKIWRGHRAETFTPSRSFKRRWKGAVESHGKNMRAFGSQTSPCPPGVRTIAQ